MMTILKWLRVLAAISLFCLLSWYFVVIDEDSPNLHGLAHIQLTQAFLAGMFGLVAVWFLVALIFGRVYCSVICPFGVMQDVFSRMAKLVRGKKRKFQFRPAMTKTRLVLLAVFAIGIPAFPAFPAFVTLLDPYSNYGRIVSSIATPAYRKANDMLAKREHARKNYDTVFHIVDEHRRLTHQAALGTALVALGVIGTLSTLYGRRYCNTICPVGTFLGLFSRLSLFRVRLKYHCSSCGVCAAVCKGECIDAKAKTVDASRCVACFNCLSVCRRDAIVYALQLRDEEQGRKDAGRGQKDEVGREPPAARRLPRASNPRRRFLHWSLFTLIVPTVAGVLAKKVKVAASASSDTALPQGKSVVDYEKTLPIIPPGAGSIKRYKSKCTGCHLCVSKCPAGIITPSTLELGLSGFMQPILRFDRFFCDYDCVICSTVCPTHALLPLTKEEKHVTRIGKAVFLTENCVVHTLSQNCASCDEHCSTKAVKMVPYGDPALHLVIPQIDDDLCIGCGACEYACPVRPSRAIYVDGLTKQEEAKPAYDLDAKQEDISETLDFPF